MIETNSTVLSLSVSDVKAWFSETCSDLGINPQDLLCRLNKGVLTVKFNSFIKRTAWSRLNGLVSSDLRGIYIPLLGGWEIPIASSGTDLVNPFDRKFNEMFGIIGTRTGLPTIDEKLKALDKSKLARDKQRYFRETMQVTESNAEDKVAIGLQLLVSDGKLSSMGLSGLSIPISDRKQTWPDRLWTYPFWIALYLDGDAVHGIGDAWDDKVVEVLTAKGYNVLRERYHAPITKARLKEILDKIVKMVGV